MLTPNGDNSIFTAVVSDLQYPLSFWEIVEKVYISAIFYIGNVRIFFHGELGRYIYQVADGSKRADVRGQHDVDHHRNEQQHLAQCPTVLFIWHAQSLEVSQAMLHQYLLFGIMTC